jgi:hypothetical protein
MSDEMRREIERAKRIIARWPAWKRACTLERILSPTCERREPVMREDVY